MRSYLILKIFFTFHFSFLIVISSFSQIDKSAEKYLLNDSVISTGHIGISVYDPSTNTYLYNYNATKNFIPASNVKLFTLYAGMKYLGDSLIGIRYEEDSTTLKISGTGDPTFLHPDFTKQSVYNFLLQKTGKRLVLSEKTRLYISRPLMKYGTGWAWDDYNESFMQQRSFFPVYGNIARFISMQNIIQVIPPYFQSKTFTNFDNKNNISRFRITRDFDSNNFLVTKASTGYTHQEIPFKVGIDDNSVSIECTLLSDTIKAPVEFTYIQSDKNLYTQHINSQPSDSLFIPMMHHSDNFFAEQTLLMVSNERLGYMNDEDIIDTLLHTDLKGISPKPRWVDGCGLSRYNLFTPQSFVYILNKMKTEFGWERMKRILPAGGEGTLKNYYLQDSGSIYAKTGSLSNNTALSGYIITKTGRTLIFSILVNNFQGTGAAVRRPIESFLKTIIEEL